MVPNWEELEQKAEILICTNYATNTKNCGTRLESYPLLQATIERRSKRFASGMKLTGGPLAYESQRPPEPLSEEDEAALAFAACGVTGFALAELPYDSCGVPESSGGNIMTHFIGRTVASGDAMHDCTVFVINDNSTWLLKRPQIIHAQTFRN